MQSRRRRGLRLVEALATVNDVFRRGHFLAPRATPSSPVFTSGTATACLHPHGTAEVQANTLNWHAVSTIDAAAGTGSRRGREIKPLDRASSAIWMEQRQDMAKRANVGLLVIWSVTVALAVAACGANAASPTQPSTPAGGGGTAVVPTLAITPSAGSATTAYTLTGSQFPPSCLLTWWVFYANATSTQATTLFNGDVGSSDSAGNLTMSLAKLVPPPLSAGAYSIVVGPATQTCQFPEAHVHLTVQ